MAQRDKNLSVRISAAAHARLRKLAIARGVHMSDVVRNLVYERVGLQCPLPSPAEDDGWEPDD